MSVTAFSQSGNKSRNIMKRIEIKECQSCLYDIVYENSVVKLYFVKAQLLKYVRSSKFKNEKNVKELINFMASSFDTLYFCDPYWAMEEKPIKYGVTEDTKYGFDNENSPGAIIDRNQDLKNSEIFEVIIRKYLIKGHFKIFDKNISGFIYPKTINLIWWEERSEDEYTIQESKGDFYELPNGIKIIDRELKSSMGDKFPKTR